MARAQESGAVDLVRKAVVDSHAQAYLAADQLHEEVRHLQARLLQVRNRGGAYRKVDFSEDVRDLLGRLEAGATLSQYVH